jgi:CO/xanthine dehydrogenase FAD-binding subunit
MRGPEYARPTAVSDVAALLQHNRARVLAGGTDLVVQMRSGAATPARLVDLSGIPSLEEIGRLPDGAVQIGAMARLSRVLAHPLVQPYAALIEAAATVGSVQVRNRATLVGNVCNGSPAADTAPALLAYEAKVSVVTAGGRRDLPVCDFWVGPGQTALAPGEWVESVVLPPPPEHGGCYLKLGRTLGADLAIAGVAVCLTSTTVRVGLASVAPTPIRARSIEEALATRDDDVPDTLGAALDSSIAPIDDMRASSQYRRAMALVLTTRAWQKARQRLHITRGGDR